GSLLFVILLIYASGIIYTKLNKLGIQSFKKQMGEAASSKVSVVSTTALGGNKTLHIVELDGKRMLLGASSTSIQLLKDLGTYPPQEIETGEFSKIEIPNIRIPKIEIPKIEFPNIGFTKAFSNSKQEKTNSESSDNPDSNRDSDDIEMSEVYEEGPDGIIDKLFQTESGSTETESAGVGNDHKVDPEEYALYKKYL
ncbi:FliO/MopB family protein, partial [bacterium]|nr:FliO/MopB family protein [bacterium]